MVCPYPLALPDSMLTPTQVRVGSAGRPWNPDALHGSAHAMLTRRLHDTGLRAWHMQCLSLSSIALCVGLWIRAKTVDQDERGNAERRALFVGLWPPMIWLIGDSLERHE